MTPLRSARRTALRLNDLEPRAVPAIVITGTPGPDVVTTRFAPEGPTYRGEILLNGAVAYSFTGDLWHFPYDSIFLPDQLTLDLRGGNDSTDLSQVRDPETQDRPIIVRGGPGNDTLVGSAGHDHLYGDAGADWLYGGIDEDVLFGDDDDQALVGGGGVDNLTFEAFAGDLTATPDVLDMNGRQLSVAAGTYGGFYAFNLTGSTGPDAFRLGALTGLVTVTARGGNDVIAVAGTYGVIDAGDGNDQVTFTNEFAGGVQILGGRGADRITLTGPAAVDGGAGADVIDARGVGFGYWGYGLSLAGGPGADDLFGSPFADVLDGGDGNDDLDAGDGPDVLLGGDGADALAGGPGDDALQGDAADRGWDGGTGTDTLTVDGTFVRATLTDARFTLGNRRVPVAGLEGVTLNGTPGNDVLDASAFAGGATLYGYEGNDVLRGGGGPAYLDGGADGNDTLTGGAGDDYLAGGPGADRLTGGPGTDQVFADLADPVLAGGPGTDDALYLDGITTNVAITDALLTVNGFAYPAHGFEAINLQGSDGDDVLAAGTYTGRISYYSPFGHDTVTTGSGADYVVGGDGATVSTGGGDDLIAITAGTLATDAGPGNDQVDVGGYLGAVVTVTDTGVISDGAVIPIAGAEVISLVTADGDNEVDATGYSGYLSLTDIGGNNTVRTGAGGSFLQLLGLTTGDGGNTVWGGAGADTVYLATGNNLIDLGAGDDSVYGGNGNDTIDGGAGNDTINGWYGDDVLEGGSGNDILDGFFGTDTMLGGADADVFTQDLDPAVAAEEALHWDYDPLTGDTLA